MLEMTQRKAPEQYISYRIYIYIYTIWGSFSVTMSAAILQM